MASIVRQLEAALITALEAALDGAARVTGFRESVESGLVKTSDGDGRPKVAVTVTPANSESYGTPIIELEASILVRLDWSDDPSIAVFDEVAAVVETLLHRWNAVEHIYNAFDALSTDNFRCDGLALRGGADSVTLSGAKSIMTTFNFAVKGIFREAETPTETTTETTQGE